MAPGICCARWAAQSLARRIAGSLLPCRSFGAAAVAVEEMEYGSEWEEEYRRGRWAAKDEWGEMDGRSVQWVFMGSPGAQKRVYATRVAELLEVPYISMGTLVRQELNPRSTLYKKIAKAVNEGKLVPEDIIFGLLSRRLEEGYQRGEVGFILDGIPRTPIQAEILDEITNIDLVVNFKCVEDCLVKKHFGSEICSHCGKSFDAGNSESTSVNLCLSTHTRHAFSGTSPTIDVEDARMEKFRFYAEQVCPICLIEVGF
ncbi:probable adenylate kinase 7, mitochondrial isoform X2 [Elaeis guineensis]|uniref:probable adenylate kinase 7, mitochondrial isoform X2 n=1 Tax=Elaeis guineensis var. tenera TaxID=51953 RepID=UPI003C6CDF76